MQINPEEIIKQLSRWYKSNERPPTLTLLNKNRKLITLSIQPQIYQQIE